MMLSIQRPSVTKSSGKSKAMWACHKGPLTQVNHIDTTAIHCDDLADLRPHHLSHRAVLDHGLLAPMPF
jgi:hypothetical protein